ncbi:MAG TPA: MBL fold metallo-hydrolase, partial [Actinomycetales bacterium]|nr:MBL fold metallo-hydrolase [Actinomycetales bacterium]
RSRGGSSGDDVRRLDPRPVRWAVNTHQHFDHVFGNIAFDDAQIHAHDNAAAGIDAAADRVKGLCRAEDPRDPLNRAVIETPLRHPDTTFSAARALDIGDRHVELSYHGRGHTDGDILVRVPDADVVFAGDLVEESAPPNFGADSFPLDWPGALEQLLGVVSSGTTVVPGHGRPVDLAFVQQQRRDVGAVAATITDLFRSGVPIDEALAHGEWPWDPTLLGDAVRRGYAQLGS